MCEGLTKHVVKLKYTKYMRVIGYPGYFINLEFNLAICPGLCINMKNHTQKETLGSYLEIYAQYGC